MLRKNINLGFKKEIPLFARNDMALDFFWVGGCATRPGGTTTTHI
jgi:hypothetical protein